jgi:hypothetical protein
MKDPKNPKNTNLTGGKGKGKGGRKTFIDDITSKSESAAQQSKLQKKRWMSSINECIKTK